MLSEAAGRARALCFINSLGRTWNHFWHHSYFYNFNRFFYLELQIWLGPQLSPSRSGSQSPGYCWVSGSGWSSSHCSPSGRHRQVSYTQTVKWFHMKWFLLFRAVPLSFIAIKSKLLEKQDHADIQIVINLNRRPPRPQSVAINSLNDLDLVRFTEY